MQFLATNPLVMDIIVRYKGKDATGSTLTDNDVRVRVIRPEQGDVHILGHAKGAPFKSETRLLRQPHLLIAR
ncbi:hypothetical protein GCM10010913_31150 [Paenibacillus aceti]|uniref:Uncharacterized protein n=1 Tax=Paenibacillus aceti TaxID=1820010 RepID=A0ABQ1W0V0_9BACL|nr:hypothetical protein GCM10010913_31150 [Paenibacillus aceti]